MLWDLNQGKWGLLLLHGTVSQMLEKYQWTGTRPTTGGARLVAMGDNSASGCWGRVVSLSIGRGTRVRRRLSVDLGSA